MTGVDANRRRVRADYDDRRTAFTSVAWPVVERFDLAERLEAGSAAVPSVLSS